MEEPCWGRRQVFDFGEAKKTYTFLEEEVFLTTYTNSVNTPLTIVQLKFFSQNGRANDTLYIFSFEMTYL